MKFGYRKPSIKKSISARTTGRAKRAVKSAILPGYGKKGMGWINNPKKAVYNHVYNKTTKSIFDSTNSNSNTQNINQSNLNHNSNFETLDGKIKVGNSYYAPSSLKVFAIFYLLLDCILIPLSFYTVPFGMITLLFGLFLIYTAFHYFNLCKQFNDK